MTLESFGQKKLRIRNEYVREFLAEFFGMFMLMVFGLGVNAQSTLSRGAAGAFLSVSWGWGMGIALGVWVSGGISGGHINPAVTLAMVIIGKLQFRKLPVYWLGQYLGAFAASACVYIVYSDALDAFDGGVRYISGANGTAGIWGTFPQDFVSIRIGFLDQFLGTLLLLLGAMAVTDSKNMTPPKGMVPLCVGLIVFVISISFGYNCGFALNPARDLSPRIFTAVAGWGSGVFSHHSNWAWVPVVAPHLGAICGAFIYLMAVGFHTEESMEDKYEVEERKTVTLRDLRGYHNNEFQIGTDGKTDSAQF